MHSTAFMARAVRLAVQAVSERGLPSSLDCRYLTARSRGKSRYGEKKMKSGKVVKIAIGTVLIIANMAVTPAYADSKCQVSYSVTDISTLGGLPAFTEGMNNRGELVGYSFYPDDFTPRAFLWSKDQGMRDLGDLGGRGGSIAFAVNDRGDVVGGSSAPPNDSFHAFLWRQKDGRMRDLGTLTPNGLRSGARSINVWGQVVGTSDISEQEDQRAFLWSPVTQTMRDLGSLENDATSSGASAISNLGHIVGLSFVAGGEHAVLWSPLTRHIRDLGTLGSDHSSAEAVNDLGEAAGQSSTTFDIATQATPSHAFFWSRGRMRDLGTLGGTNSVAHGMNNWGQVVGTSQTPSDPDHVVGADHAFLWSKGCGMQDLNDLISPTYGIVLSSAADINNLHHIVAEADLGDRTHSYLLTPISDR
jgi:probable HAF family extracellular repeat protein